MPKNCEDPEFMAKWKANEGRFARDPEAARRAQAKGTETKRARKAIKDLFKDPGAIRDQAVAALLNNDPEVFEKVVQSIAMNAVDGDKAAQQMMMSIGGLDAPKKTEATIKADDISPEEAKKRLMKMMNTEGEG